MHNLDQSQIFYKPDQTQLTWTKSDPDDPDDPTGHDFNPDYS